MKPAAFEYLDPGSVEEAVAFLGEHGDEATILAGGQSLMPLLNMRLARPSFLIDLGRLGELDYLREADGALQIGAMTSKRSIEESPAVEARNPLLQAATRLIGHPQIRNRGTVGGSMAQADPAAEYPALAVALDAELQVTGPSGSRTIAASDFFVTYLTTALDPTELLTEVRIPMLGGDTGWSIQEVARRHGDFAMTGAVVTMTLGRRGACAQARIVLFGVGAIPIRVGQAEQVVVGEMPGEAVFRRAAEEAAKSIDDPLSDVHASAEYRLHLAEVLTRRALGEAAARAGWTQE